MKWEITVDGKTHSQGKIDVLDVLPLSQKEYSLPIKTNDLPPGEALLTLSYLTRFDSPWVKAGYEQSFDQFVLQEAVAVEKPPAKGRLDVKKKGSRIEVKGESFSALLKRGS